MAASSQLPESINDALNHGVLQRLPLTFLPFVNQQLHEWEYLFPNEQRSLQHLLQFVDSLDANHSRDLFREVGALEQRMKVREWKFSTNEETIENASQLARSPYFQEWRRAVQSVFDAAERHAMASVDTASRLNRLVLIDIPRSLDVDPANTWGRWQQVGKPVNFDISGNQGSMSVLESLVLGNGRSGILHLAGAHSQAARADIWVVDADHAFVDSVLESRPAMLDSHAILLSYTRLDRYRAEFSHEMNTMRKDLSDADAVYDQLRKVDVLPWCPPEVATDPATREFIRALYLTGNGAVIFGNSFVEWAASEAFRRARPRILVAKFGLRSKPKPFTAVAVFENPDQVNPIPSVDDVSGSSIDAQMLALYVWLAAFRFEEYQQSTVCVCVAESLGQAYVISPPEFSIATAQQPISVSALGQALADWIA